MHFLIIIIMSHQQALKRLAKFMIEKNLKFDDLRGILALKPQTTV